MAELALGVIGVLPVLVKTVSACAKVHNGFHTLRHWSEEVREISDQYYIRKELFMNEARLLLLKVVDEKAAKGMVENQEDERWKSEELSGRLRAMLNDRYQLWRSIIEATYNVVDAMAEEMKRFPVVQERERMVRA